MGSKRKSADQVERASFAFAPTRIAHPRFDYLCIGGYETLFAALLVKKLQPEAFVAAIFVPSEGDVVLPTRFSPLLPDFTQQAFHGLPADLPAQLLTRAADASSRLVESFITIDDMAESFNARLIAGELKEVAYLDPFEARHALPALREDGAEFYLEGAYALRGSRLYLLDALGAWLLSALHEAGAVLFDPHGLTLEETQVSFDQGGTLPYGKLLWVDFPGEAPEKSRPVVGVKTPLLSGAALVSEGFYGFSVQRSETIFIGRKGEMAGELASRVLNLLPGLEGIGMSRSFHLPVGEDDAAVEPDYFTPSAGKIAGWLGAQGLGGFGARGARAAAATMGGGEDTRAGQRMERMARWFAGQR